MHAPVIGPTTVSVRDPRPDGVGRPCSAPRPGRRDGAQWDAEISEVPADTEADQHE